VAAKEKRDKVSHDELISRANFYGLHWDHESLQHYVETHRPGIVEDDLEIMVVRGTVYWVTDAEGRCILLSEWWQNRTGRTFEQDRDFGWREAIHPEDLAKVERRFQQAQQKREPFGVTYRLRCRDAKYTYMRAQGSPKFGANKEYLGFWGTAMEIPGPHFLATDDTDELQNEPPQKLNARKPNGRGRIASA
jgi:PAS domain S-box-containing protein